MKRQVYILLAILIAMVVMVPSFKAANDQGLIPANVFLEDSQNETAVKEIGTASCIISGYKGIYSPRKVVVEVWNK
jgi:hypothetical protein